MKKLLLFIVIAAVIAAGVASSAALAASIPVSAGITPDQSPLLYRWKIFGEDVRQYFYLSEESKLTYINERLSRRNQEIIEMRQRGNTVSTDAWGSVNTVKSNLASQGRFYLPYLKDSDKLPEIRKLDEQLNQSGATSADAFMAYLQPTLADYRAKIDAAVKNNDTVSAELWRFRLQNLAGDYNQAKVIADSLRTQEQVGLDQNIRLLPASDIANYAKGWATEYEKRLPEMAQDNKWSPEWQAKADGALQDLQKKIDAGQGTAPNLLNTNTQLAGLNGAEAQRVANEENKKETDSGLTLSAISGTNVPPTGSLTLNVNTQYNGQVGQTLTLAFCVGSDQASDLCQSSPTISGGQPPYHFVQGSGFPPMGTTLHPNGLLNGTFKAAGTSTFNLCVVDMSGASSCQDITITVTKAPTPTATATPKPVVTATPTPKTCEDCDGQSEACYQTWHAQLEACRQQCNQTPNDSNCFNERCYSRINAWQAECGAKNDACHARNPSCNYRVGMDNAINP